MAASGTRRQPTFDIITWECCADNRPLWRVTVIETVNMAETTKMPILLTREKGEKQKARAISVQFQTSFVCDTVCATATLWWGPQPLLKMPLSLVKSCTIP
ncbi:hypothetical protein ElyMa_004950200 [Elysia marginata]|uniref:Uncharacterized protein n=1 Tax=Elysia marginata TaxID=1093978 RepID=A0AAV4J1K2_9GAST|nr:hypothetical protein ElyMa_004950200 [Elysia marginata]